MEEILNHIGACIKKVKEAHKGEDWQGVIECPQCGKDLHVSIAGTYNNHVWGQCETEGCLSWMQ